MILYEKEKWLLGVVNSKLRQLNQMTKRKSRLRIEYFHSDFCFAFRFNDFVCNEQLDAR